MAKDRSRLPHLFTRNRPEAQKFISPREARGNGPPNRNPKDHGDRLFREYRDATRHATADRHGSQANGCTVRFESAPEFNLKLQSLDVANQGMELLAVKPTARGEAATVYIPDGALKHFERPFHQYATEITEKGNPKRKALVAPIESVRIAVVEDLWTEASKLPPIEEVRWYGLWLLRRSGSANRSFGAP